MVSKQDLSSLASRFASSMGLRILLVMNPLMAMIACGPKAPVYHGPSGVTYSYATTESGANGQGADGTTESLSAASAKAASSKAGPTPIRATANAAEKQAMQALYAAPAAQGGCAECHGALEASTQKGRTAIQIQSAEGLTAHADVVKANKWPKDVADTTDDGMDTAQLYALALSDLLYN